MGDINANFGVSKLVNPLAGLMQMKPIATFPPLPKIGWESVFDKFINSSLSKSLSDIAKAVPSINDSLVKAGIVNGYDLYIMKVSPIDVPTLTEITKEGVAPPETLVFVSVGGQEKKTKLSVNKNGNIYQVINIDSETSLDINLKNSSKATAKIVFDGNKIKSTKDKNGIIKFNIKAPSKPGVYILKAGTLTLEVRVEKNKEFVIKKDNNKSDSKKTFNQVMQKIPLLNKIWNWLKR